ncbi:MAG: DNA alkylation repair protein [Bacillota bacterium]|nr:DNA alkylation repair protein [Bacillota bacterium]
MELEELKKVEWFGDAYKEFIALLASYGDEEYGRFNSRIIPDVGESFNVRMPVLRKIAREVEKNRDMNSFYNFVSSGGSYEEKLLQGILFSRLDFKSFSDMFNGIDYYILKMNNWAICDSFVTNIKPLVIKNRELFFQRAENYIESDNPWAVRFGLVLMNNYFKEEEYLKEIFRRIKEVKIQDYYVNMAVAWLLSSCYLVDRERTKEFLTGNHVDDWCINKAIQKIVESLRVSTLEKEDIKKLKKKKS